MIKTLSARRRRSSSDLIPPITEAGESKGSAMDLKEVKRLIQLVQKTGIGELEVMSQRSVLRQRVFRLVALLAGAQRQDSNEEDRCRDPREIGLHDCHLGKRKKDAV